MSLKTAPTPDPAGASPKVAPDGTPLEAFFKGNRSLAAAALFLLLQAVPVAGLVISLKEGGGVWMVMTVILMAGALLPPLGVALGQRWGYVLGQYVVWGSMVGVVLRVLQTGFTPLFLLPAVLLGVLLVALSPPRTAGETRRTEKKPESFGVWVKENIEAIIIAFIMALVIRCFCIEVFKIPSSSMEPILLGDVSDKHPAETCPFGAYHVSPGGDRIMVTKYYYAFSQIERFDVVVFKFPLNQAKNFIKRVVGLPDESLKIYRGNLYVKKKGEERFQIARRTLRTQDSIWIDPAKGSKGFLGTKADFERSWDPKALPDRKGPATHTVTDGELSTQEAAGERSLQFSYKPGSLDDGSGQSVDDMHIAFEFEMTSPRGQVFAELANAYGRFEVLLDTEGGSLLRCHLPSKDAAGRIVTNVVTQPLTDVRISVDHWYKLDLSIVDGMAYVRINDGEPRARQPFIDFRENLVEVPNPERRIAFGTRGVTFKVKNLALGRDIYYRGRDRNSMDLHEDEELVIPAGHYVMMGDNVANSHDSRAWLKHTYTLKNGKSVVCEEQQIVRYGDFLKSLQEKYNLPKLPDLGIDGDEHGNEVPIFLEDIVPDGEKTVPLRWVEEKYIVGKALWIWWPQGRWFHLIR
jgi:signal peptidase I